MIRRHRPGERLLLLGAIPEVAERQHANVGIRRLHAEDRRRRPQKRRQHRPAFDSNPAFLLLLEPRERLWIVATLLRDGQSIDEQTIERAHPHAAKRLERIERHGRIRIRGDGVLDERNRIGRGDPARIGRDRLENGRPHRD
jgi:hypothetical protein